MCALALARFLSPTVFTRTLTRSDFGEPDAWPHVSSSFGSFDLAGFPKAAVYWCVPFATLESPHVHSA